VEEPFPKGQDKVSKAVAQAWKVTNPNAGKENLSLLQRILKAVGITPTKQVISSSPDQGAMALASWKEGDAAIHYYDNAERKLLVKSSVPEQERAISSKFKSFTGHSPERDPHKESSRGLDRN
jgi:hypothetical protein